MKAAEAAAGSQSEPIVVDFDDNDFQPPPGPFYDDTAELIIEDDVELPYADGLEEDVGKEAGGSSASGAATEFDSALETALWMNTAGQGGTKLPNRSRDEWLKLMKDERYRLEECLSKWKSHRDMDLTIMKAAVGNVRKGPMSSLWFQHCTFSHAVHLLSCFCNSFCMCTDTQGFQWARLCDVVGNVACYP